MSATDPAPRNTVSEQVVIGVDGSMHGYLVRPDTPGRYPAVIVGHELFGVNADIQGVTGQLASLGYVAVAPEFYHRSARPGTVLPRDEAGRTAGFELVGQLTRNQAVRDVRATMSYLDDRDDTTGRTGMVGFSYGGHLAYLAATQLDLAATAVLYGGWLPTTDIPLSQPEPTLTLTPGITGRLLYLVGERDHLILAAQRRELAAALTAAEVRHEIVVYPEAEHAFFWEQANTFHRASRDDAWQRVRNLLRASLTE